MFVITISFILTCLQLLKLAATISVTTSVVATSFTDSQHDGFFVGSTKPHHEGREAFPAAELNIHQVVGSSMCPISEMFRS